jgi:hypothetical protein
MRPGGIDQAPGERVRLDLSRLHDLEPKELGLRFVFGALTSAVAAVISIAFGPRVGGIMLAFPATLAATFTLIKDKEGADDAREDARGAVAGAVALTAFAGVAAALFGHMPGALVLAIATLVWLLVAVGLYFALWGWGPAFRGAADASAARAGRRSELPRP